jgi:hypothetical protein
MIALSSLTNDAGLHFGNDTPHYGGFVGNASVAFVRFAESFFGLCKLRFSLDIEAVTFS